MGVGRSRGRAGVQGAGPGRAELRASLAAFCLAEDRAAAVRHAGEHHGAAGGRGGFPLVPQGAGAAAGLRRAGAVRRDARPGGACGVGCHLTRLKQRRGFSHAVQAGRCRSNECDDGSI